MIAVPNNPKISPDEYFEWESQQETRYEYINGKGDLVQFASISFECAIAAIYEDVEFLE